MVSKASEDLPEPERPVKTASLSRGISTSMFLRLCSRAPRMVIARDAEPAGGWRFALSTSSISAFPDASETRHVGRALPGEDRDQAPMIESRNIERTRSDFQCRVRIINRLFELALFWRQQSAGQPREPHSKTPPFQVTGTEAQAASAGSLRSDSSRRPE